MMKRILIALLCLLMLSGCLSPAKVTPSTRYLLNKMPCDIPVKRKRPIVLLVSQPETRPVYNTTQMAYSIRPYQISYYSLNQWAEVPTDMFQPLLVETMVQTHHFKAIVTPPFDGHYDYVLNTEIVELLQDYTCRNPVLRMTVRAQILRAASGKLIGTRTFSVVQPLSQRSPVGGVYAANAATAQILNGIACFSLEVIR